MSVAIPRAAAVDKGQFDAEFESATSGFWPLDDDASDSGPYEEVRADECDWLTGTCYWTL